MKKVIISLIMFLAYGASAIQAQNCTISSAIGMLEEGRHRDCFDCLKSLIDGNHENAEAYVVLGELFWCNEMYDDAIKACNDAIKYSKTAKLSDLALSYTYFIRADCHYTLSEYNNALADINQSISLDKTSARSYLMRISILIDTKSKDYDLMYKDANARLKLAGDNSNRIADAYVTMGRIALYQKDYDATIAYYQKAIEYDNNNHYSFLGLSRGYHRKNIYDKAFDTLIEACRKAMNNGELEGLYDIACDGFASIATKYEYEQCKARLIDIAQNESEAWWAIIAKACKIAGKYEDVVAIYEMASEEAQKYIRQNILDQAYQELAMFDKAAELYDINISETDDEEKLYYYKCMKALSLEWAGHYDEALSMFDELIEQEPTFAYQYYRKGFILNNLKRYDEAVKHLETAYYIDEPYLHTQITLGQVYLALGKKDEAMKVFQNVCEAPESENKLVCEPFALFYLGETDKAIESLERLLESGNNNEHQKPDYYTAACIYSLMNDKEKALDYLDKAMANGYVSFNHSNIDGALSNIRGEKRFAEIVNKYKALNNERIAKLSNK